MKIFLKMIADNAATLIKYAMVGVIAMIVLTATLMIGTAIVMALWQIIFQGGEASVNLSSSPFAVISLVIVCIGGFFAYSYER